MPKKSLKYFLFVLGCQMNVSDAEKIAFLLEQSGYQQTQTESEANLIIVVACSVRQSAIDRIYGKANAWLKNKKKRNLTLVLTGCLLTIDRQKMSKIFDLIFDINNLEQLPFLLNKNKSKELSGGSYFSVAAKHLNTFQAYVPISTGCNNFCTYCVVPYTRGREISRPSNEIIAECQKLISQGYKEITLLGQNVNSYGLDLKNDLNFPELLKEIADLPGYFWLKFATSHPKDVSDDLIRVITENKKICKYIHLPVQSGDNGILKKMNRKYTVEHYLKLIKKIRQKIKNVMLSTDIIVGFPGETKQQFNQTVKLMKTVKYDMAYLAQYSPRPQTVSFNFKDSVSKKEKSRRENLLNSILKKTALANNKRLLGKKLEVLVRKKQGNYSSGLTRTQKNIRFKNQSGDFVGQFVNLKVTKANEFSLEGTLQK
jgi:tRNA-2-methylthio-N6-dimethylallyladenosine synthase